MNCTLAETTFIPPFYYPLLYTISLLNAMVTALSVWVIVRHSPPSMAVYRWFLLNVALSCFALDTFVTVVVDPIPLLPLIAICTNGFLAHNDNGFPVNGLVSFLSPSTCKTPFSN